MEPRELLQALMDRDGDNPNSLAGKLRQRTKQPQIYKFLEGIAKEPRRSTLEPIAEHYGVSVDAFYDPNVAQAVFNELIENRSAEKSPTYRTSSSLAPILSWEHEDDLPPGEFVLIPRFQVVLSAGNGHEQIEIEFVKKQPQAFRADWIRQERLKPSKLASMTAHGESMEPTIWNDDALIIDTSQVEIQDGKVYAIWYEGGERVKRLFRLPGGGLRVKSDNPSHETFDISASQLEHVRVIGRVVHRAGKGGL